MEDLVRRLNGMCDEMPFHTGWYLKDLRTGQSAERFGHLAGPSASTRKISVLMTALKAVNEGRLSLDQPVTMQAKYQNNNSGVFQHLQPGFTIPFRDCLIMMIIVSDNTCTGTVVDMVGIDQLNDFCRSIGMVGTTHRDNIPPGDLAWDHPVDATNATTPADVGLLLEMILDGSRDAAAADRLGCTPELCQYALQILSWQKLTSRLPYLMPPDAKIAHKTGSGVRNYSDAGIIFRGEEPLYILTVYVDQLPGVLPDGRAGRGTAHLHIAQLCRTCWDYLTD